MTSTRRARRAGAIAVGVVLLSLVGCDRDAVEVPPSAEIESAAATPDEGLPTSPGVPSPAWQQVDTGPSPVEWILDISLDSAIVWLESGDGHSLELRTEEVQHKLDFPAGTAVDYAASVGDSVVYTASSIADSSVDSEVRKWDPQRGTEVVLDVAPTGSGFRFELAPVLLEADGAGAAYIIAFDDYMCVRVVDERGTARDVYCGGYHERLTWPRGWGSQVSFLVEDDSDLCAALVVVDVVTGVVSDVTGERCVFRGVARDGLAVWTELPEDAHSDASGVWFDSMDAYAAVAGERVAVGKAAAGTEALCGATAVWNVVGFPDPTRVMEVDTHVSPFAIYESPDDPGDPYNHYATSKVVCDDNVRALLRTGWWADAEPELVVNRGVSWASVAGEDH